MLHRSWWTWIGLITLLSGLVLVYLVLTGFGGSLDCGTFGLHCIFYSVFTLPTVVGISVGMLWVGVPKGEASFRGMTFTRVVAVICSGMFGVLLLGVLILCVMVAGRG